MCINKNPLLKAEYIHVVQTNILVHVHLHVCSRKVHFKKNLHVHLCFTLKVRNRNKGQYMYMYV